MKKGQSDQAATLKKGDRVRTRMPVEGFFLNPGPDLPDPLPVGGQATVMKVDAVSGLCRVKYRDAHRRKAKATSHRSDLCKIQVGPLPTTDGEV